MESKRITKNVKWVVVCKAAQSILQLVIGMLSARYLGPSNYGLINYAKSIVAFVMSFAQLGMNSTLVKELIDHPTREGQVLGTSLGMGMMSSFVCTLSVYTFVSIVNAGEPQTILVCLLYSLSMFFQVVELIQYWFHSRLQSKFPSIMALITYVVVSSYKIFLLITGKSVYWFAVVYSIEYGLTGFALLMIYHKRGGQKLQFDLSLVKPLLKRSIPYIWAAMMVTVFHNTDHIMLKFMNGNAENGYYSAAITCASVCQFVFLAVIDSMRPVVVKKKKETIQEYENSVSKLYCIIIYLAVLQGIAFTVFADLVVYILYGAEYMASVPVLKILAWQIPFSFMGKIRNVWILVEEKQKCLWKINLAGVLLNVALNYVMIPLWGASGAALASILTQAFTNFGLGFIYKPIRSNNRLMLQGINPAYAVRTLRNILKIKLAEINRKGRFTVWISKKWRL
ncbi:MAG: flippase [Clostridia bacterium]|nr:flippase [Clostridia bacterium]